MRRDLSHHPRRPVRTVRSMADAMLARVAVTGSVTDDDLLAEGYSRRFIERHRDAARELAAESAERAA